MQRVTAFIDGFNPYHAVADLGRPALKWVNLWTLAESYVRDGQKLERVLYFTAFATWKPGPYARHRAFVTAQASLGVEPILGRFKTKDRHCKRCNGVFSAQEEKRTDVNIALHLLNEAYRDSYDLALLLCNDSDLVPAVEMVRAQFLAKRILVLTPPGRTVSRELEAAAGGPWATRKLTSARLEQHLLPAVVNGVERPGDYDPA